MADDAASTEYERQIKAMEVDLHLMCFDCRCLPVLKSKDEDGTWTATHNVPWARVRRIEGGHP